MLDSANVGAVPPPPLVPARSVQPTPSLPALSPVSLKLNADGRPSLEVPSVAEMAARERPKAREGSSRAKRDELVRTSAEEADLPPLSPEAPRSDATVSPTGLPPVVEASSTGAPIELEEDSARLAAQPKPRPVPIVRPVRGLRSPSPNPAPGLDESTTPAQVTGTAPTRVAAAYAAQPPVTTPAPEPDLLPPPIRNDQKPTATPGNAAAPAVTSEPTPTATPATPPPATPGPNPAAEAVDGGTIVEGGPVYEPPIPTSASYQAEPYVGSLPVPSKQCPVPYKKPCCLKVLKQKCCACIKQKCAAWKSHCFLKGFKQKCCLFKKYNTCSSPQSMPVASCQSVPVPSSQSVPVPCKALPVPSKQAPVPVPCKVMPVPSKQCPVTVPSGQYVVEEVAPLPSGQWGLFSWRKPRTSTPTPTTTSSRGGLFAWLRPSRTATPEAFGTSSAAMAFPTFDQGAVAAAPRVNTAPAPAQAPAPANNAPRIASPARSGGTQRASVPVRTPSGGTASAAAAAASSPLAASTYIPYANANGSMGRAPADPAVATASRVQSAPAPKPKRTSLLSRLARRLRGDRSGRGEANDLAKGGNDVQRVSADRVGESSQR